MRLVLLLTVAILVTLYSFGLAIAQNVGPPADIAAVEAASQADGDEGDKILQVVVVGRYAVVEAQRTGVNSVSTEAYTARGNQLRPQAPGWHLAGVIDTVPAPCWLQEYGFPEDVAEKIADSIDAMKRMARANPRYECD